MPIEPAVASPRTLDDALTLLRGGSYRPIAGGTDLMVQLAAEVGQPPHQVLDLWRVEGLRGIAVRDGTLSLGALTTYSEMRKSPLVRAKLPALAEAAATIGAAQIQNRGTLGGNAVNASPAGDTLPILLATGYADLPEGASLDLPRLAKPYHQDQLRDRLDQLLG